MPSNHVLKAMNAVHKAALAITGGRAGWTAGNMPVIKIYPNVGHFIHTDVPHEFARDTVDFLKTRRVDAMTPDVIEALIHGAAPVAA